MAAAPTIPAREAPSYLRSRRGEGVLPFAFAERRPLTLRDLAVFFFGLLSFIEIPVGGRLYLFEILSVIIVGFEFLRGSPLRRTGKLMNRFLLLLVFWLLSQMASDLYRSTPFEDFSRGWAKIIFFGFNFLATFIVVGTSRKRYMLLVIGGAIGSLLRIIYFPSELFLEGSTWKFGYGIPFTTLAAYAITRLANRRGQAILFLALCALNLVLDFRSLGGICLGAGIMTLFGTPRHGAVMTSSQRAAHGMRRLAVALSVVAMLASLLYMYQAVQGMDIGINVGQRVLGERERNPLYGRLQFVVGLMAALDSPIIGQGSWAKDEKYTTLLQQMNADLGLQFGPGKAAQTPSHSYLVGSWVQAGFLGAVFWGFVLVKTVKALLRLRGGNPRLVGFLSFILIGFAWDILFSPFGGSERIPAAFNLFLVEAILRQFDEAPTPRGR